MHQRRPQRLRKLLIACLVLLFFSTIDPPDARANSMEGLGKVLILVAVVGGTLALVDTGLLIYDVVLVSQDEPADKGGAIAQTVLAAPQALGFNIGLAALASDSSNRSGWLTVGISVPTMMVSAMTTYGVWSLASPETDPKRLFGLSTSIGCNAALTSAALGAAGDGRLSPPNMGLTQMVLTTPSILVGVTQLKEGNDRVGWAAQTAWSGALFAHGALSLLLDHSGVRKKTTSRPYGSENDGLFGPVAVAPTLLSDGTRKTPGLMVAGSF